jgi:PTS system mannitol-specific IIC component
MNPVLILAVIAGGASGVLTFSVLNAGLVAAPSPGSIFALLAMTPKGGFFATIAGVLVSTVVTFLVAAYFIKRASSRMEDDELEEAQAKTKELKGTKPSAALRAHATVKTIVFACDAGMGSSAMGATTLKNKLKKAGLDIDVVNYAIDQIPQGAQIVVTHESLTDRARSKAPNAEHISIKNFINSPEYDKLVSRLS